MLTSLLLVGFRNVLRRPGFPTKNTECVSVHFGACHMLRPSYTHHHDFLPVAKEIWILRLWWFIMNISFSSWRYNPHRGLYFTAL